jgi:hypothetical protein
VIKRLCRQVSPLVYPLIFICLLAVPLLLPQDSQPNNSQPANIGGTWQLSWEGRGGSQQATIQIQQDGSALSGTFQDSRGPSQLTGNIDGNKVSFSVQVQGHRTMTLAFTGTIDGDKMSGTFQPQGGGGGREGRGGGQSNHSWSAVRQQGNSGHQSVPAKDQDDTDFEVQLFSGPPHSLSPMHAEDRL